MCDGGQVAAPVSKGRRRESRSFLSTWDSSGCVLQLYLIGLKLALLTIMGQSQVDREDAASNQEAMYVRVRPS